MANQKVGTLFRSYARSYKDVVEVTARAVKSARIASSVGITTAVFIVPTDVDCGSTASMLRFILADEPIGAVLEAVGDQNSDVLNEGLKVLRECGLKYAAIVSNKASGYLNSRMLDSAVAALENDYAVVGIQIKDLDDVLEVPIQNTCAFWNIEELLGVGGFDSKSEVEEIAPLVRILRKGGKVGLLQSGIEVKLDIRKSADGQARHAEVRSTKRKRQEGEATRMGTNLAWINERISALA